MATAAGPSRPTEPDRHGRRRPFTSWVKRLTSLKNSSNPTGSSNRRNGVPTSSKNKKGTNAPNNPYPLSGTLNDGANAHLSFSEPAERRSHLSHSEPSFSESGYEQQLPATGTRSGAPTLSTNADTTTSDTGHSKTGTSATAAGGVSYHDGGEGSTFSSPAPSVRSLTTTLTTVQSTAPSNQIYGTNNPHHHGGGIHYTNTPQSAGSQQTGVQFTHQFPTSPAPAIPPHLAPHPTTYSAATANNLLTDNASVLTLASSSKRRRRNSLDTNASVRALAPSSIFSGSRESLPLSVLSGNNVGGMGGAGTSATPGGSAVEPSNSSITGAGGVLNRPGIANAERVSVYSSGGDRASFSPMRQTGDSGSTRSGLHSHHGRNDSTTGSIGGVASGQFSSSGIPGGASGRTSRRGSGWGEIPGSDTDDDNDDKGSVTDAKGKESVT